MMGNRQSLSEWKDERLRCIVSPHNHFAIHKAGNQDSGLFSSSRRRAPKQHFWEVGAVKVRRDLDVSRASHPRERCCNHPFQCREEYLDVPAAPYSVDRTRFSLQLGWTFTVSEHDRIIAPGGLQIGLDLLLSRPRPRCVVALCDTDATVTEKYGNSIERNASK